MRLTLLIFIVSTIAMNAQIESGIITMKNGEKIPFYDGSNSDEEKTIYGMYATRFRSIAWDMDDLFYFAKSGEIIKLKQKEIKTINFNDSEYTYFTGPHYKKKAIRMHRLIAKNDKYVLGYYSASNGEYLYIFSLEGELVKRRLGVYGRSEYGVKYGKNNLKKLYKVLPEYFPNCTELYDKIKHNAELFHNDNGWKYRFGGDIFSVWDKSDKPDKELEEKSFIGNIICN